MVEELARTLIRRGDDASGAGFYEPELHWAEVELADPILLERLEAIDDDVRAKALHRDRLRHAGVQQLERGGVADEDREAVREGDWRWRCASEIATRVTVQDWRDAAGALAVPSACVSQVAAASPWSSAVMLSFQTRAVCASTFGPQGNLQRLLIGGTQGDQIRSERRLDEREPRLSSLAHEYAFGARCHPVTIPFEPGNREASLPSEARHGRISAGKC